MSDLLQILSAGTASLAAQRAAVATASHNIQNANTPGYARQRAVIEATLPAERVGGAFIGRGARLQTIQQARDRFIEAQLPGYLGNAARSQVAASALEAVSALDPEGPGNLGDAISGFYAALRGLAQNAGDAGARQAVVGASRTLALAFNRTRAGLEDARTGLDARLAGSLSEVNSLSQSVARLNAEIRSARAGGGEPNDLLDARQKAVDQLATLTGATPVPTSDGDLSLFLPGGTALVTSMSAATLSAAGDAANGGHLALRIAQPGAAPRALPALGGELGGLLDARDGALREAVDGIDALAFGLAGAVNAAHRAGYDLNGAAGGDLLDAGASSSGAAARIAVSAAVIADPRLLAAASALGPGGVPLAGDGRNALGVVATERAAVAGGLDPTAALAQVTSAFGASAQRLAAAAAQDGALRDHLVTMREATSGVSIDEELIEMQKAQRAFEAISKVIQVSNEMFDTLLQLK
jgi:flagellar hook-associated protein 1 FlgK